jgi:hypothetical protein
MERLLTAYQEDLRSFDELRRRMPELRAREESMRAERQATLDQAADRMSFLRLAWAASRSSPLTSRPRQSSGARRANQSGRSPAPTTSTTARLHDSRCETGQMT